MKHSLLDSRYLEPPNGWPSHSLATIGFLNEGTTYLALHTQSRSRTMG